MKTFDCEQGSPEWWKLRRGVPTASEFGKIITPKTLKVSAQADGYICRLLGDLYDPFYPALQMEATAAMRRGTVQEEESRNWYALENECNVKPVGFVLSSCGRFGCSPDGLVGEEGLLELKNPLPATQVEYLLAGALPDEYRAQVHGQLIVTGREWADFLSYCPGLPPLQVRVRRDPYTEQLEAALEVFWDRFQEARSALEAMGSENIVDTSTAGA